MNVADYIDRPKGRGQGLQAFAPLAFQALPSCASSINMRLARPSGVEPPIGVALRSPFKLLTSTSPSRLA